MPTRSAPSVVSVSLLALAVAVLPSCGGSPTVPSPNPGSFLNGRWAGTLTISRRNQPDAVGPTTWTFAPLPDAPAQQLRLTIESNNPWLPVTMTSTAVVTPATPPADIGATGTYPSPRGCAGNFVTTGTATAGTIIGTFTGADCNDASGFPLAFTGGVQLTKQ